MVKKVLTWGGIAFLIFFIAFRPDSSRRRLQVAGRRASWISPQGFGDFFTNLVA